MSWLPPSLSFQQPHSFACVRLGGGQPSLSFQQPHSFACVRLRGVLQQWVGYKSGILNGGSRNKYKRFWRILKIGLLIMNFESWAFGNAWHQINICELHRNSTHVILIYEQNAGFSWEMPQFKFCNVMVYIDQYCL